MTEHIKDLYIWPFACHGCLPTVSGIYWSLRYGFGNVFSRDGVQCWMYLPLCEALSVCSVCISAPHLLWHCLLLSFSKWKKFHSADLVHFVGGNKFVERSPLSLRLPLGRLCHSSCCVARVDRFLTGTPRCSPQCLTQQLCGGWIMQSTYVMGLLKLFHQWFDGGSLVFWLRYVVFSVCMGIKCNIKC